MFRPLAAPDLPEAAALWHEGWHAGHRAVVPAALSCLRSLESFHDRLSLRAADTHVAEQGGEIVGIFILQGDELYQFYVARQARGTGAAPALMASAEQTLRGAGVTRAWLACTLGNTRAARFYEKSGWRHVRTETMSFETSDGPFPLDVWRYEKDL